MLQPSLKSYHPCFQVAVIVKFFFYRVGENVVMQQDFYDIFSVKRTIHFAIQDFKGIFTGFGVVFFENSCVYPCQSYPAYELHIS